MKKTDLICGIVPALVTPMAEDEQLDEKGLESLIDHVIGAGVGGVVHGGHAPPVSSGRSRSRRRRGSSNGRSAIPPNGCPSTWAPVLTPHARPSTSRRWRRTQAPSACPFSHRPSSRPAETRCFSTTARPLSCTIRPARIVARLMMTCGLWQQPIA